MIVIGVGIIAGVLSALFGVGGGLLFVPALIFLGESTHQAVAGSLVAMVPVVAVGSWRQTRYGNVRWRDAAIIGIASIPTAKIGEVIANSVSDTVLRRAFAVLLLLAAAQMAWRALRENQPPDQVEDAEASP